MTNSLVKVIPWNKVAAIILALSYPVMISCNIPIRPCNFPCPPPPEPSPIPTPTPFPSSSPRPPRPTPNPSPTPNICNYRYDPTSNCSKSQSSYWNSVNQVMSRVTNCPVNSDCQIPHWQPTLVAIMEELNRSGFCSTYDLSGSNPGSEMGVRRSSDNFTEYYQPITTAYKIRWADAQSVCIPVWDSSTVEEVRNYQGQK